MTGWSQQSRMTGFRTAFQNQELPDFTNGVQAARQAAMTRVTRQAHELEASGVVGLRFELSQHTHERRGDNSGATDLIVTVHALGTAIAELATQEDPPPVYIALPLSEETR